MARVGKRTVLVAEGGAAAKVAVKALAAVRGAGLDHAVTRFDHGHASGLVTRNQGQVGNGLPRLVDRSLAQGPVAMMWIMTFRS